MAPLERIISIILAIVLLFSATFALGGVIDLVFEIISRRLTFGLLKELHSASPETVYAAIYLPLFAAIASTVSGVGINVITDANSQGGDKIIGATMLILAFAILFMFGRSAIRRYSNSRGLHRIRLTLSEVRSRGFSPLGEGAEVRRRIARLSAVGSRIERDSSIPFRSWLQRRSTGLGLFIVSQVCNGIVILLGAFILIGTLRSGSPESLKYLVLAAILILMPNIHWICSIFAWKAYQGFRLCLGREISTGADRALKRIDIVEAKAKDPRSGISIKNPQETCLRQKMTGLMRNLGITPGGPSSGMN